MCGGVVGTTVVVTVDTLKIIFKCVCFVVTTVFMTGFTSISWSNLFSTATGEHFSYECYTQTTGPCVYASEFLLSFVVITRYLVSRVTSINYSHVFCTAMKRGMGNMVPRFTWNRQVAQSL